MAGVYGYYHEIVAVSLLLTMAGKAGDLILSGLTLSIIAFLSNTTTSPRNLSVVAIFPTTAVLIWTTEQEGSASILRFEVTYELVGSPLGPYRVTQAINAIRRTFILRGLFPISTYRVFMITVETTGFSNTSNEVEFTTATDAPELIEPEKYTLKTEEVVFVTIVVIVWAVSVVVFLRKWDHIRILQPMEPRYKHNPKNLESVRIVKRPQDSIIYKGYGRKMSITMMEREKKRLERMGTLPTIKMEEMTEI